VECLSHTGFVWCLSTIIFSALLKRHLCGNLCDCEVKFFEKGIACGQHTHVCGTALMRLEAAQLVAMTK
jgi:hypothetical protein